MRSVKARLHNALNQGRQGDAERTSPTGAGACWLCMAACTLQHNYDDVTSPENTVAVTRLAYRSTAATHWTVPQTGIQDFNIKQL